MGSSEPETIENPLLTAATHEAHDQQQHQQRSTTTLLVDCCGIFSVTSFLAAASSAYIVAAMAIGVRNNTAKAALVFSCFVDVVILQIAGSEFQRTSPEEVWKRLGLKIVAWTVALVLMTQTIDQLSLGMAFPWLAFVWAVAAAFLTVALFGSTDNPCCQLLLLASGTCCMQLAIAALVMASGVLTLVGQRSENDGVKLVVIVLCCVHIVLSYVFCRGIETTPWLTGWVNSMVVLLMAETTGKIFLGLPPPLQALEVVLMMPCIVYLLLSCLDLVSNVCCFCCVISVLAAAERGRRATGHVPISVA